MPLPPGLTINRATGAITGTPQAVGSYSTTLRVRDAQNQTRDIPITMVIANYTAPSLTGSLLQYMTTAVPYTGQLTLSGGTAPFVWSVVGGTLPAGISINAGTGAISGTPSGASSTQNLTVRVVDNVGSAVQYAWTLKYAQAMAFGGSFATAYVGAAYSDDAALTGGHAPITYALTSGTLPAGLTLNTTTGFVSGTPTTTGTSSVTITATDASGATRAFTGSIAVQPAYTAISIGGAATNTTANYKKASGSYTQSPDYSGVTISGGTGSFTYSWARISGSTSISAAAPTSFGTGFSGTVAAGASASSLFRLTVADGTSSATLDVTIAFNNTYVVPTLSAAPSVYSMRSKPYSSGYTVNDGVGPFVWAVTVGTLPTGMSINSSTGLISGTPTDTSYGNRSITIRATDSESQQATGSIVLQYADLLQLTGTAPSASQGQPYSFIPTRTGGFTAFTYAVISGTLPAGLSLNTSTGEVSGTPTTSTAGTAVTIQVTDAQAYTASVALNFVVVAYAPVSLTGSVSGQSDTVQTNAGTKTITPNYASLSTSGGLGTITYSWARISGSVAISANASTTKATSFAATASPGATISALFRLTATDGTSSATFDVTVQLQNTYVVPSLSGTLTSRSTRTAAYSSGLTRSNGLAPFVWSITSGTLPTGLTIDTTTGIISGTPTDTAYTSRTIGIRVTDSQSVTADSSQTITYRDAPAMSTATLGYSWRNTAYSASAVATNAASTHTLTYSLQAGTLPTGVTLNTATGALTGTPTSTTYGNLAITIRATDPDGINAQAVKTIPYANALGGSATTPNAYAGTSYSGSVTATGGFTPYTYAVQTGALPTGTSLNASTGAITGTPTTAGAFSGTIRETDTGGMTFDVAFSATISAVLSISKSFADSTEGASYSGSATAAGGASPYTYSLFSGSLPTGLSLNTATGAVTGTPTTPGAYTFVIRVTDSVSATADTTSTQVVIANTVDVVNASITYGSITLATAAGWRIGSDGTTSKLEGITYTTLNTWLLSGAGSSFEVQCTVVGDTVSGAAISTWLGLGTTREWKLQDSTSDGIPKVTTLTIQIRRAGGTGVILDTATIDISSERF